jgi:hypothetical protein
MRMRKIMRKNRKDFVWIGVTLFISGIALLILGWVL